MLHPHEPFLVRALKRAYEPIVGLEPAIQLRGHGCVRAAARRRVVELLSDGPVLPARVQRGRAHRERQSRSPVPASRSRIAWVQRWNVRCCAVPEVVSTGRRTGRAELDEHLQGVEAAEIDVRLEMGDRPKEEVLADIRDRASLIPGTNVNVGQPISHRIDHMLSGTRSNIAVKIFGDDLRTLRALAEQVRAAITDVPGVVDLSVEQQTDIPTVSVRFNREALARYGLPAGTAAQALKTAFLGQEVGSILEGQVAFPMVVRYEGDQPEQMETIRQTVIDTPSGARVPLSAVADIREDRSPNFVTRENVQRKIVVSCNVADRDLRSVVNNIQDHVQSETNFPAGYRIEYGGQFESEAQASRQILLLGVLVVVGILVILTHGVPVVARRPDHHEQPPAGADRRRRGRFPRRRRADGRLADRVHHAFRHRHTQRHHADLAHQASDDRRRRDGFPTCCDSGLIRKTRPHSDDCPFHGIGADTYWPRVGEDRERDSRAIGARGSVRIVQLHSAEHDCRSGGLLEVRKVARRGPFSNSRIVHRTYSAGVLPG